MARANTVTTLNLTDLQRVVYSKEILMQATPILKWAQFAQKKTELGVLPGHTLQMLRMANIKRGTRLGEIGVDQTEADAYNTAHPTHRVLAQSSIPMNKLATSTRDIRVYEYGNGISVSEMELQTAIEDTLNIASKQLGRDYARVLDDEIRETAMSVPNVIYGAGRTNRNSITTGDLTNLEMLRELHERLAVNKAQPFMNALGESYIMIAHPHQTRSLRSDSSFLDVTKYTTPSIAVNGEIGKMEKIRIIETTALPIVKGAGAGATFADNTHIGTTFNADGTAFTAADWTAHKPAYTKMMVDGEEYSLELYAEWVGSAYTVYGNTADVYRASIFGDYAFGWAESLPVELRDGGVIEHGRVHELVWYSIFGTGILNEDSIFNIESL